ncbi:unnamed protein product [Periconia digitata]|uniref:Inosine/uridine-preferring nucleoside hydrolase domain-containing protein n=1 Tax=Periconia digitata TaxID=1303443 RepID=A0A9W4U1L7_9PLEO|nr:unnamed protein product [Periconia digitata]
MAPNRIIIDTDPGVDDVLAMLLAFSAKSEELEVLMLSLTFGNVEVQNCLRNVVTLFHHIEKERAWRKENGRPEGFEALMAHKPIVAVGAEEPLAEHMMVADFFHGVDGLGGIHSSHPHLSPSETWKSLFLPAPENLSAEEVAELQRVEDAHSLFTPSLKPAHEEMLQILRDNEPDTITIVAVGPLTNLAIAAAKDPEAFLRVKEVLVMGGAVDSPGNMTPGAEFNTYADSVAAARVYALTSPNPKTTMPPSIPGGKKKNGQLGAYPEGLSRRLTVKLFPLDITNRHTLPQSLFSTYTSTTPLPTSPLVQWTSLFLTSTYRKISSLSPSPPSSEDDKEEEEPPSLQLHDPLPIYYAMTAASSSSSSATTQWQFSPPEDLRVETAGQWTRGCCVVDRRGRSAHNVSEGDLSEEVVGDAGGWRDARRGNRVVRALESPDQEGFGGLLLERVFGGL